MYNNNTTKYVNTTTYNIDADNLIISKFQGAFVDNTNIILLLFYTYRWDNLVSANIFDSAVACLRYLQIEQVESVQEPIIFELPVQTLHWRLRPRSFRSSNEPIHTIITRVAPF